MFVIGVKKIFTAMVLDFQTQRPQSLCLIKPNSVVSLIIHIEIRLVRKDMR